MPASREIHRGPTTTSCIETRTVPVYTLQPDRTSEALARSLRQRARHASITMVITVTVATFGFVLLESSDAPFTEKFREGFWKTINLVSTVGSLPELSSPEQVWALLVIMVGLGAVLYGFANAQQLFQGGDIYRLYQRKKMNKSLKAMQDHIVVCGYGHVGRAVCRHLRRSGADLVVIDNDPTASTEASDDGFLVIEGDCANEEALCAGRIEWARGLVSALNDDAGNVFITLLGRELNPRLRVVARAARATSTMTLRRAGAERVIVPGEIAAAQLSNLVLKPHLSDFVAEAVGEGEFEFAEVAVADHPEFAGRTLGDLDLPRSHDAIIISLLRGDGTRSFNPPNDLTVKPEDTLLVVTLEGSPLAR